MRSCLAGLSVALVSAALLFGALPASAKPADSQDNSFHTDLDRDASMLEADGKRALTVAADAIAHAVHDGSATLPGSSATLAEAENGRRQARPRISRSVKRAESQTRHDRRGTDHPPRRN